MIEETQTEPTEKQILMDRAKKLGITFSNNITVEKLREKINEKLEPTEDQTDEPEAGEEQGDNGDEPEVNPFEEAAEPDYSKMNPTQKRIAIRQKMQKEKMALVRIRVACMNPDKKNVPGEVITVSNKYLGNVSKFIPFGEESDEGYHVPRVLYEDLNARKFLFKSQKRDKRTGRMVPYARWMKEFSIEVLPQLTKEELERLANAQAAAGAIDNGEASVI